VGVPTTMWHAAIPPPPELQQMNAAEPAPVAEQTAAEFKVPNAPAAKPKALYKMGDKLVLAAPAHTGLPNGATAIVAVVNAFDSTSGGWSYAVTLTGGGANGSGIQFIKSVREAWLRTDGRIATAKACAPMAFGAFARLAPRIIVPLFQRRYCWGEPQWKQLWQDIVSPRHSVSATNPHAIGRVVIARETGGAGASRREALVLVDGQQRTTTLMLLLCALRDVARSIDAEAAEPLISAIDNVLFSRTAARRLKHGAAAASAASTGDADGSPELVSKSIEHAQVGLESLAGADTVRLIPSRDDRLPFCSLVLSAPFERSASGARKMSDCYNFYKAEVLSQLRRGCFETAMSEAANSAAANGEVPAGAAVASAVHGEAATGMDAALTHSKLALLSRLLECCLRKLSLVVFELQDGVALQNMYDMLAQRERGLAHQFANVGGKAMSQSDLVRNMLLNHIADEDERVQAYDDFWRPMEHSNGEGDPQALERFLTAFLLAELPPDDKKAFEAQGSMPAGTSAAMLEGFGALVRSRGGTSSGIGLFAQGTDAANAQVVDSETVRRAVLDLLRQLRDHAGSLTASPDVKMTVDHGGALPVMKQ